MDILIILLKLSGIGIAMVFGILILSQMDGLIGKIFGWLFNNLHKIAFVIIAIFLLISGLENDELGTAILGIILFAIAFF